MSLDTPVPQIAREMPPLFVDTSETVTVRSLILAFALN